MKQFPEEKQNKIFSYSDAQRDRNVLELYTIIKDVVKQLEVKPTIIITLGTILKDPLTKGVDRSQDNRLNKRPFP